jgi:hypothetical protein
MTVVFATPTSGGIAVGAPGGECAWLRSFLTPAFGVASGVGNSAARVRLVDTPPPSAPPGRGGDRVAFVLDGRPVRLATAAVADTLVAVDPELQLTYAVRGGNDAVVHRGRRDDLTRIALMRVVREYAHNALVDSGGLVVHAAAFAGPRGAVLVTGPKGVGKTTLLARMLSSGRMFYLANDRVGITPDLRSALSIPTIVAVRSGTRRLLPELAERLRPLGRFTDLDARDGLPPDRSDDSWYFAPSQFAGALSCDVRPRAPLAAVVALRPDAPPGPPRRAAPAEAAEWLTASLLGAQAGVFVSEIFRPAPPAPRVAERLEAACRRIAAAVPCVTLPAPAPFDAAVLDALSALCL